MAIRETSVRVTLAALGVCWLTPVLSVGLIGAGLTPMLAIAAAVIAAVLLMWAIRSTIVWIAGGLVATHRIWLALFFAVGLMAIVSTTRLAAFMAEPARTELANSSRSFSAHSCLLAYFEGARFARADDRNIYVQSEYRGRLVDGLRVDPYHYPPPFLLLPAAIQLARPDFRKFRAVWFTLQALLFAGAILFVARWIGGEYGAWSASATWLLLASAPVLTTLQVGNFQMIVLAIVMLAMILLARGHLVAGGSLLAYATLGKIFPGLFIVYLLGARRWRAVGIVAVASAVLGAATVTAFGWRPIVDFVTYEVPRIANGEAFPQAERAGTIPLNQSFYGLLVRLRLLGVAWLDVGTGLTLTSIYGVIALLLAAVAGWRVGCGETPATATSRGRLVFAQLLLALLSVAAFRSPFVGSVYGFMPTLWLLILLAAGARTTAMRVASLAAFAVLHATQVLTPTPLPSEAATAHPSTLVLASTALVLAGAIALNVGVIIRVLLRGGLEVESDVARTRLARADAEELGWL